MATTFTEPRRSSRGRASKQKRVADNVDCALPFHQMSSKKGHDTITAGTGTATHPPLRPPPPPLDVPPPQHPPMGANNASHPLAPTMAAEVEVEHTPIHIGGGVRSRCAYCSLKSRTRRTRYKCSGCGVPLCSIGSGKVDEDCFTQAHRSNERQLLVSMKYQAMQKNTTNRSKKSKGDVTSNS